MMKRNLSQLNFAQNNGGYREHNWLKYAVLTLVLIYVAVNVFRIGGYEVVLALNSLLPIPLSTAVAVSALLVMRRVVDLPNRRLWLGLSIGFICWSAAEALWAVFTFIQQEVPYPSVADFFWLMGYLPMYFVLGKRLRALPKITPAREVWPWVLSFVFVVWALVFVILPNVRSSTPGALFESALSVTYVLADLILLVFTMRLLFAVQGGLYGRAWLWVSSGLIIRSVADLLYAYAFTINVYYPGELNWISTLGSDVPYNLSYIVILVGIFIMRGLIASFRPIVEVRANLAPPPNTHILVFTREDDTVIGVSQNYPRVYPGLSVNGKTIAEVLGLPREDEDLILQDIKNGGLLREKQFQAVTPEGQREIGVSGISVRSPQGEYAGATLLVRVYAEDPSLDELLTPEQRGTVRYLLHKTGVGEQEERETREFLTEYCQLHLRAFYNRVYAEGGSILAEAFISELRALVEARGWHIEIQPNGLNFDGLSLSEVRQACTLIIETGRRTLTRLIGVTGTDALVGQIYANFPPQVVKTALYLMESR